MLTAISISSGKYSINLRRNKATAMKILMLCNKSPWPKHEGGPIAMHAMITGLLKAGHSVKVLAANTNKYTVDPETVPAEFRKATRIEFVHIDLSLNVTDALINFIGRKSYHVSRFHTKAFEEKLVEILKHETFDIIHLEMLYMAAYMDVIRKHSGAPIVLRAHNVEHKIWERIAGNCSNPLRKFYLNHLYKALKRFEIKTLDSVDGIVAITPVDSASFTRLTTNKNIISIPFGIDLATLPVDPVQPVEASLFHIGAMNWFPNEEGIKWLISEVWPEISERLPGLKLHLAGRYMPDWLTRLEVRNITVDGEVPDVWQYMQRFSIMVVPLFSGSGIRIKIVEAMAAGKAIVTTTVGSEGINYVNGQHLLIADDAHAFADAIVTLCKNNDLRRSLGENARKLIEIEHDNSKLIEELTLFYNRLARKN
jgi:glycosyltransferase involved in cell wall biosynthesis